MDRIIKTIILLLSALLIVTLSACSYIPSFRFPGVYKIDIQQGNVVKQEFVDQLKVGMTKKQVRYVMGTPLIVDTFNQERWDYFYSIKTGKGKYQEKKITLSFDGDTLDSIDSNIAPNDPSDAQNPEDAPAAENNSGQPLSFWR